MRIIWLLLTLFIGSAQAAHKGQLQPSNPFPKVAMKTTLGTIVIELDRTRAPLTVDAFLAYVVDGDYDQTLFHRIIPGFVAQGGGIDTRYSPKNEKKRLANESGNGLKNSEGTIAMARQNAPHSATRQFFFNLAENDSLNPSRRGWGYTVFGEVVEGHDILLKFNSVQTEYSDKLGWPDVPVAPVILEKATLLPEE
ncbi:peptidyl-prolyl cis-trans isomerase [Corallincola holothuriorum]|uniref:Peptidyl-prolyl cis-trans isomerase n=1 Tax=Corallincola holothuriorum TaxID=2282215 RepID=A0A368NHN2_9GAMM|nr:peptidylprolyl isomerase [Corallincola holothuriorum]RCU49144.1 peptidyl-prolyl cis-trans isomerase [Corallincola holothuriorum]